ncbi:MAG TPA: CPBP family intramembrane glutamic endopeptidase [Terriglobia bacterium]|nr:CPBP family intramembrane glutamic endopeptidase [Terriglobia bacterium]
MKKGLQAILGLTLLAALSEGLILIRIRIDPWRTAALLESVALLVGAFVALTQAAFIRQLRHWATSSAATAAGMPFLLLVPYLIFGLGTGTFSAISLGKLIAYILVPIALLLPDRLRQPQGLTWRDVAAMAALAVPVSAGWLQGIWTWPQDIYVFRPIFCVLVGGYAFMVLRNLEGVGFSLVWKRKDIWEALLNLLAFSLLAIPIGISLDFLHPHPTAPLRNVQGLGPTLNFLFLFIGIYLTVAIPEEMLFRGFLQNLLMRTIRRGPRGLLGLLIASVAFGASHLHHAPVPNWRYAILATLAGLFYGNVYRTRQRLCASALTHALVDTIWHFWL